MAGGLLDLFKPQEPAAMDPRMMGLLGMAAAVAQANAPQGGSRLPVARPSLGYTLGMGAGGYGQGYGQGIYQDAMAQRTAGQRGQNYAQDLQNLQAAARHNLLAPYLGHSPVQMPGASGTGPATPPQAGAPQPPQPAGPVATAPGAPQPTGPQGAPTGQPSGMGGGGDMSKLYSLPPPVLSFMGINVPPELSNLWAAGYRPGTPEYDNLLKQYAIKNAGMKGITEPTAELPSQVLDPKTMTYGVMPGQFETMGNAAYVKNYAAELPKTQFDITRELAKPRDVAPGATVVMPSNPQGNMPAFRLPFGPQAQGQGPGTPNVATAPQGAPSMTVAYTNPNSPALMNFTNNNGPQGINYGDPPRDMTWARNNDGQVRLTPDKDGNMRPLAIPVAGGPLDRAEKKQSDAKTISTNIVTEDIKRVTDLINAPGFPVTGVGSIFSAVPGSPQHDAAELLRTIGSNVGFDRLQSMREASPTGGALGSITEGERADLQATMGALKQSQSKENLLYNLNRLNEVQLDIIHGKGKRPAAEQPPQSDTGRTEGATRTLSGVPYIVRNGQWERQ